MIEDRLTILIVDDTETNIDILLELLSNRYDILVALDAQSALEIVQSDEVDLVLLDIMMPEMDGYEVCEILKAQDETKDIPVVFITAKTDEDSIEEAYRVGGSDYVTKPFKPRELLARVDTQLKLKKLIANLEYIASYDAMTGIYSRRKFFELALKKFSESKKDLYATMIDIDKFKEINDKYGHSVGDEVIKEVTKTIAKHISQDAIFGRIGGDEFALISDATSKENMARMMNNIRESIETLEFIVDDDIVKCTISNGIAKATDDIQTLDLLLKEADKALYEAKGRGRNRIIFR